jgi:hypothetical protein
MSARFFYFYRDIAGTLYPVLVDVPGFEKNLETFLHNRAAAGGVLKTGDSRLFPQRPFGMNMAFIGLLFAVLASGCQSSDLPAKERELTSQVYGIGSLIFLLISELILTPDSLLLLPMPSYVQLCLTANSRSYEDTFDYWECLVL